MKTVACQCEHISHFHDVNKGRRMTPNGNPAHKYGASFARRYTKGVNTDHGLFTVCMDCAEDCHQMTKVGS